MDNGRNSVGGGGVVTGFLDLQLVEKACVSQHKTLKIGVQVAFKKKKKLLKN